MKAFRPDDRTSPVQDKFAATRKAVHLGDLGRSDMLSEHRTELVLRGFVALVAQPVKHQREVLGVWIVLAKDTHGPDPVRKIVLAVVGDPRYMQITLDKGTVGWRMVPLSRRVQVRRTADADDTYVLSSSEGVEKFGRYIQPLMKSRQHLRAEAAQ